jgi:lipid-binding SYLF domain-containing protein
MRALLALSATAVLMLATSVTSVEAGWNPDKKQGEVQRALDTITAFKKLDPTLDKFFKNAYGYAVFPSIGKGGFIVGGAHGKGIVFNNAGAVVGKVSMSQGTFGAQIGGQKYSEVIFFGTKEAFEKFTQNKLEFAAQATAVAATAGAGKNANYSNGVAIFSRHKAGLMAEAVIGGQQFEFTPVKKK